MGSLNPGVKPTVVGVRGSMKLPKGDVPGGVSGWAGSKEAVGLGGRSEAMRGGDSKPPAASNSG